MGEAWKIPSHSRSPHSSHTTPAHARASLRPPVFNPYDRFTQPEFDAWIGDITSALKRALSHEAEAEVDSPPRHSSSWTTTPDKISGTFGADGRAQSPASSEARDDESPFEDSFAQIASRRAKKGKARDPREGPGLGFKGQPIELSSDSEEEEVVNSLEAGAVFSEGSDVSVQEDSGDDTDYAESELDEGGEASSGWPGTSTQHIVELSSRENSGQDQQVASALDVEVHHNGYEDLPSPRSAAAFHEDDGDGIADLAVLRDRRTSDEFPVQSESAVAVDVELVDPWEGPRTFAEDYYSGGDRLAPGPTPNHLTPLAGSPAPAFVADLPTVSKTDADGDQVTSSAGVLSTSHLLKPHNIVDSDGIDELLQYGTTASDPVNNQEDIGEPVARYYDPVELVDVTVQGSKGRDLDQTHEIISVPPSDDEHTDADGEEDEGRFVGLLPLGTSDLDIRDDWGSAGRREDVDDVSEEDELQEMVSSQTVDEVAKAVALTLSKAVNSNTLNAPLVNLPAPILASTFQLTDTDSFGDLPVSSPPSETPSPAPGQPTGVFELQQHSIEELFANLERESSERRSQAPEPPGSLARQPEAETANVWASQELENILSGDISAPDSVVEVSGSTPTERCISQEDPGYIVEEVKFETQISPPDDDFGEIRSIPPPDLVETIQLYDVEEPKTDGRLTEESEITIESSRNEGTTVPQLVVSSAESTATPITSEQHVYPVPSTQGPSQRAPVDDLSQAELSSTIPNIPAPIVADPSVPDPVPGDSSHPPPIITNSPDASGLSIIPPSFLRVIDHDSSQISSASGLFTPAQRSEGGTSVQLEDDTAEALTTSHNGADKGPATALIPLQPGDDPSPIERSTTGYKDDGDDEDIDACVDEFIESSQPNERHMEAGTVGVDARIPAVDFVESADKIFSLSCGGTTELSVSQFSKEDSTLACDVLRNPLKGSPEHPGVPNPSSARLLKSPSIAGGDEDADGEVDPDYSHIYAAKNLHQTIAHQPDGEVSFNKIIKDTLSPKVTTLGLESRPTSASVDRQEPEAAGEPFSGSRTDTPSALQDSPSAEGRVVQDKGDFTTVQSEVKTSDEKEHQTRVLKRKRREPNPGSTRITRSESGGGVKRGKKKGSVLSSRRTTATSEKAQLEWVDSNVDADSVDDGTSETASVSSGTSAVYRLLRATSRTRSVVSSTSGDASWTSPPTSGLGSVIPLIHSHGFHRHDWPAPPSPALSAGPHKGARSEQVKAKSPIPTHEPSTPSLKRTPSINSPVTRSNCRFHKISLPRGEDRVRAYFVVPGCALGDGELMDDKDIRDEGFSTHEDHKRMLPNVETLDLNPYLVGVLRQLVGVDLLREQQEIFYLPSEEEKPKKRRQTDALERLRQFQRQSISSGGPLAREYSPRLSEVSQDRGTPRSASGSVVSDFVREGSALRSNDGSSILGDPDNHDDPGETPPAKRPNLFAMETNPPLTITLTDGELDHSAAPERFTLEGEEPTIGSRPPAPRRSKRKTLNFDTAAYKPSEDDVKDDDEVEETKTKRSNTRRATKRSRTAEEITTNAPKSKRKRLGRNISVAGAGPIDS